MELKEKIKKIKKIAPKTSRLVIEKGWNEHFITLIGREVNLEKGIFEQVIGGRIMVAKDNMSWVGVEEADGKTYALVFRE